METKTTDRKESSESLKSHCNYRNQSVIACCRYIIILCFWMNKMYTSNGFCCSCIRQQKQGVLVFDVLLIFKTNGIQCLNGQCLTLSHIITPVIILFFLFSLFYEYAFIWFDVVMVVVLVSHLNL